ncbi:hypothetical protein [Zunongwangia endophytica]|uniref:Uncharacterized protein n=1 Tax=Zunongwangia endophytica TaxID=1808945 RepID=A0ABV8HBQ7_9FLAO|nr:hypothetical protein [Zunongwangia endophytica]MDN3594804.1 hypothetical protein [Zunongwangia endophytica]
MKKIFGFQVSINNKTICRAGFENENSIVTCILDSIRRKNHDSEKLNISISGLNSDTHQYADWYKNNLHEGDKISIEIISNNFDTPNSIGDAYSEKDILKQKLKSYKKLKEELKDYLEE